MWFRLPSSPAEDFSATDMRGLGWEVVWKDALLVGAGAALGATARYAVFLEAPLAGVEIHVLTTFVNVLSCLAMGLFAPGKFWGMGVLGGFSTLSAVAIAAAQSTPAGALVVLCLSFATCVVAWFVGDWARAMQHRRTLGRTGRRRKA